MSTKMRNSRPSAPLEIPEILEHILAELPCRQLFLSQRVCQTWLQCIQTAPRLQRRLSPGLDHPVVPNKFSYDMTILPKHDPLLKHVCPGMRLRAWISQPGQPNERPMHRKAALSLSIEVDYTDLSIWEPRARKETWRKIQLTCPRLRSATLAVKRHWLTTKTTTRQELYSETGLTFGDVYDRFLTMRGDLPANKDGRQPTLGPDYVGCTELRPAWHDASTNGIMLQRAQQFDHLLEPCSLPICSTWLPKWETHCRWVNCDRFDTYKMLHMFYHGDDNTEWNRFDERRYIDVDAELVLERHDTRELRFEVLLH